MKEFTTIAELASAKTREEIVTWAAEMQKCPYDYEGKAFEPEVCKEGADAEQCNQCWLAALKDVVCKGEEPKKRRTTKKPKEELAAKDSNEGVKALKQLASTMTKEEFMKNIQDNKICPSMYGFPDTMSSCQKHAIGSQCVDCWSTILDSLEFKLAEPLAKDDDVNIADGGQGNTHIIDEVPVVDTTELIAPVKNNVKVLAHMDKLVEEIKNFKAQQSQWDALLKEKIAEATAKVKEEKAKLQRAIDYNMSQIVVEFPQVEAKETKTQKKVSLVSGDIVLKKAAEKIDYDKDKLLAYFKNSVEEYEKQRCEIQNEIDSAFDKAMMIIVGKCGDEYERIVHEINCLRDDMERLECANAKFIKVKEEVNWADFKKTLAITGGTIVDTSTGEAISIDGLNVISTEERFEIG